MNQEAYLQNFKAQIEKDLECIISDYSRIDSNLCNNKDYAFIYWILFKIFNLDEELILDSITEYNDKGIDCFVHYEETKELYIIQCKHYDVDTKVVRESVSDFLASPISFLNAKKYKKSKELQKIYSKAIEDSDYKIYFHFYTTNTKYSEDIGELISQFNTKSISYSASIKAAFFDLKDLYEKYYGENYKKTINLSFDLQTINKGTFASLQEEYGINYQYQGYYIITPVEQIYKLVKKAKDSGYRLFEENIREYLGESGPVNSAIATTLRSEERINFLYYNNGITIIVKAARPKSYSTGNRKEITLQNPQIVNGCQTVNTIFSVLNDYSEKERLENFKDVFVMTKLLIIPSDAENDKAFYRDVVKYTNKQNPIPDKVFSANNTVFERLQIELKRYGLWIKVKQSDKVKFDELPRVEKANMLEVLSKTAQKLNLEITQKDTYVDLEKILQICLAFITDGYNAFTKKSLVLKNNSDIFKNYSFKIQDYLSHENIMRLYLLYKLAERDRKNPKDEQTTIPYYVLGFLSYHIKDRNNPACYNTFLDKIFEQDENKICQIYNYLKNISDMYKTHSKVEYNVMIKQKIDTALLDEQIATTRRFMKDIVDFLSTIC